MLLMFYQTVVSSVMTFGLVCWRGNATGRDLDRLNKLIKKAGSCVRLHLDNVGSILADRHLQKPFKIQKDDGHPLHSTLMQYKSKHEGTRSVYVLPEMRTDRFRKSFIPSILRISNSKSDS